MFYFTNEDNELSIDDRYFSLVLIGSAIGLKGSELLRKLQQKTF